MKLILLCAIIVSVSVGQSPKRQKTFHNDGTLSNCPCGSRNSGRIVGGMETRPNEYPWMVALKCGLQRCGGSIITPFHVLTAAHCAEGLKRKEITIFVGRHHIFNSLEGVEHSVAKIIKHEEFTGAPHLFNDIAILVTKEEIKFNQNVGPVCLSSRRFDLVGKELKVTGWGETKGTGDRNILHEVDLKYVLLDVCRRLRPKKVVMETQLCAQKYQKDVCHGDSGDPVVYLNPDNNRYTQVAVVSYGEHSCRGILPIVNTDVFSFIDWILATISENKPGVKACAGN